MPKLNYLILIAQIVLLVNNASPAQIGLRNYSKDEFLTKIVNREHQLEYQKYYTKIKDELNKYKQKKNQSKWSKEFNKKYNELVTRGRASLQTKRPVWAEQLNMSYAKSDAPIQKKMDKFLFRCGTYDEFLEWQIQQQKTVWARTRNYVRNAGNSVASWFNSWKKPKTINA